MAVYPRACGGTQLTNEFQRSAFGLSPRVRGNLWLPRPPACEDRSIPARAGEPGDLMSNLCYLWVYPRACGGTAFSGGVVVPDEGLSPRVRGNLDVAAEHDVLSGSIPARAGEPPACAYRGAPPAVYPRACGGTLRTPYYDNEDEGLSPRVRGNPIAITSTTNQTRSIPARAGEPRWVHASAGRAAVYPRACGGTQGEEKQLPIEIGLSPRVRGNRPAPWR